MARISRIVFGSLAVSLTFGAIQLASGSDLSSMRGAQQNHQSSDHQAADHKLVSVNRMAKGDRFVTLRSNIAQEQTLSFNVGRLVDTSVLLRLPAKEMAVAKSRTIAKLAPAAAIRRPTLACEPVVSVLTDIARQLQPGRCLT